MNDIHLTLEEMSLQQEKFLVEANIILSIQKEVDVLQEQLDRVMEGTHQREFEHGRIVDFENLLLLKKITEALAPKQKELRKRILRLSHELLPGDIFIDQHFFDSWVSVKPGMLIRFSYDNEHVEMVTESESDKS